MKYVFLSAVACVVCACADATAPSTLSAPRQASNAKLQDSKFPSSLTTTNPCNGDVVVLTGETQYVAESTTDKNGGTHSKTSFESKYTGIGAPSGAKYNAETKYSDEVNTGTTFLEEILKTSTHLEASGKTPNYEASTEDRYMVDANGNVTTDSKPPKSKCEGKA